MFKIHYLLVCVLAGCFGLSLNAQNWSTGLVAGGSYTQFTTDIVDLDDGGSIVVGNYSKGTATFGSYALPWSTFSSDPNNSNVNSFIVKYAANNTVSWATRISSPYTANIVSVAADDAGYVYVCGQYTETTSFYSVGASTPFNLYPIGSTSSNGFVAKYTPAGVLIWAKNGISTSGTESLHEIAVSDDGTKLVAAGRINTALPITVGPSSVSTGSFLLWVNSTSGAFERAYNYSNDATYANPSQFGLCIDASKNIYVAGSFTGTSYNVTGSGSPISVSSPNNSAGSRAIVVAKYNASGALQWARASRATKTGSFSQPSALVCDASNNVYLGASVNSTLSNYTIQFYNSGSSFTNIPINTGFNSSFFVVKLNGSNGYAMWNTYGRQSATGTRAITLAVGSCNDIYAGINTAHANPSFTDVNLTTASTSLSGNAFMAFKLNQNGVLQSTQPYVLNSRYNYAYLGCRSTLNVHCASGLNQATSLQTSGSPINLSPNGIDVLYARFTNTGSAPTINLTAPSSGFCAYDNIPLSGTVTGTGPFTISWNIYDSTSGTYVNLATTGTPSLTLTPGQYNPYIFTFFGYQVIYLQVTVTNCSGQSATAYQFIAFYGGVTFSQVTEVDVCYTPGVPTSDAVFSVTATYATSYEWQYSTDGVNWYPIPLGNYIENLNQLTVQNPSPSQNGYLFRCIMYGPCNTAVSSPAVLNVLPCPGFRSPEMLALEHADGTQFVLYPNPVGHALTVEYHFAQAHTESRMIITDLTGRILSEMDLVQQGSLQQDVSQFANGTYLCLLAQGGDILKKEKFVVQH